MARTARTVAAPCAALCAVLLGGLSGSPAASSPTPAVDARCELPLAPPYGGGACPGVRPGAVVTTDVAGCTLGFLLSGSDGRRYAATAGHCALATDEERTWPKNGPAARDDAGRAIGRFVYAVQRGDVDFGLIRLDRGVASDPALCHFGGPTGLNTAIDTNVVELRHVGQGVGDSLSARTAEAPFGLYRADYTFAWGLAYLGDSGSPVVDATGRAVGLVTHLKASGLGDIGINRLGPHLARAQLLLRLKLTLLTAPTR